MTCTRCAQVTAHPPTTFKPHRGLRLVSGSASRTPALLWRHHLDCVRAPGHHCLQLKCFVENSSLCTQDSEVRGLSRPPPCPHEKAITRLHHTYSLLRASRPRKAPGSTVLIKLFFRSLGKRDREEKTLVIPPSIHLWESQDCGPFKLKSTEIIHAWGSLDCSFTSLFACR